MEPAADQLPTPARWAPRPVETATAMGCGVIALLLAVVADPGGRLLFGVAALGLFVLAAVDLALRPRLTADREGIRVHTLTGVRALPWPLLERVDVDERTRYGLVSRALELEAAGHLIVLSRRTLGADPRDVADALARIRYTA